MNNLRWAAIVAITAALHLHAQTRTPIPTQSPAPAAGPTMEQTIAFINDIFGGQGMVSGDDVDISNQSIKLIRPCVLTYEEKYRVGGDPFKYESPIDLEKADPLSLKVTSEHGFWRLTVEQPGFGHQFPPDPNYISAKPEVGTVASREVAQKIAKAYIHAMVLCHKSETPSLF
ncbi:MAG: hypothetical protein P4K94_07245 [Terracidiphilus sp.]|nr:hypothetical protein [Terracidiphilus sp.]